MFPEYLKPNTISKRIAKKLLSQRGAKVICVISGPSGSGKTTLLNKLSKEFETIEFKDLDELDNEASDILQLPDKTSKKWKDSLEERLFDSRQILMDDVIENSNKDLVFGGIPFEDEYELDFPEGTKKFLLSVDAETAAKRAFQRSQHEDKKYRRKLSDLPLDIQDAEKDISRLKKSWYEEASEEEIRDYISRFA
jgi:shikimate kinase